MRVTIHFCPSVSFISFFSPFLFTFHLSAARHHPFSLKIKFMRELLICCKNQFVNAKLILKSCPHLSISFHLPHYSLPSFDFTLWIAFCTFGPPGCCIQRIVTCSWLQNLSIPQGIYMRHISCNWGLSFCMLAFPRLCLFPPVQCTLIWLEW